MAHVIPFTPRSSNPSGLLRGARERAGLSHAEFAKLLGSAIGRHHLSPGTIRAWETNTVEPPAEIVDAAQQIAAGATFAELDAAAPARSAPSFVVPPPAEAIGRR